MDTDVAVASQTVGTWLKRTSFVASVSGGMFKFDSLGPRPRGPVLGAALSGVLRRANPLCVTPTLNSQLHILFVTVDNVERSTSTGQHASSTPAAITSPGSCAPSSIDDTRLAQAIRRVNLTSFYATRFAILPGSDMGRLFHISVTLEHRVVTFCPTRRTSAAYYVWFGISAFTKEEEEEAWLLE